MKFLIKQLQLTSTQRNDYKTQLETLLPKEINFLVTQLQNSQEKVSKANDNKDKYQSEILYLLSLLTTSQNKQTAAESKLDEAETQIKELEEEVQEDVNPIEAALNNKKAAPMLRKKTIKIDQYSF